MTESCSHAARLRQRSLVRPRPARLRHARAVATSPAASPVQTPHSGFHVAGRREGFEGWYWRVCARPRASELLLLLSLSEICQIGLATAGEDRRRRRTAPPCARSIRLLALAQVTPAARATQALPAAAQVTLPDDGGAEGEPSARSFALIYSYERGLQPCGDDGRVGVQVMGPGDGYVAQTSTDTASFWGERNALALGACLTAAPGRAGRTAPKHMLDPVCRASRRSSPAPE